jgi:hypothetical protein
VSSTTGRLLRPYGVTRFALRDLREIVLAGLKRRLQRRLVGSRQPADRAWYRMLARLDAEEEAPLRAVETALDGFGRH